MYKGGSIYNATKTELLFHFGWVKQKHHLNQDYCRIFGMHFRKLREAKGIGMREFALVADMEYSTLSKIERGVTNTTISTALHLAESLGVSHSELFDFKFPIKSKKDK